MVPQVLKKALSTRREEGRLEALERENARLRERLDALTATTQRISVTLAEVSHRINGLVAQAINVAGQARRMAEASSNIRSIARVVAGNAQETARSAQATRSASESGNRSLASVVEGMSEVSGRAEQTERVIERLESSTDQIDRAATVIQGIAQRTSLLALNAAIEAARAGESGRGFAVVAEEVRKLSDHSSQATQEIAQVVQAIKGETGESVSAIGELARRAQAGAAQVREVGTQLQRILDDTVGAQSRITEIAQGATGTSREVEVISGMAEEGERQMAHFQSSLADAAAQTQAVGETLFRAMIDLEIESVHLRHYGIAREAARAVGEAFAGAIAAGRLATEDLFDRNYVPIPNTRPQKYRTRFDALCDQILPPIQEALIEAHPALVFAIAVDERGYCPTHNRRFSRPLTGDYDKDLVGNRTKRLFDDPTGRRCGAHSEKVLVQTYKRDTGEIMHDLSVPIEVGGRHWGGFRIGYKAH
jgi:methyl-accepting chemotaxis protein